MADNLQPQQIVSADDSSNLKLPEDPATPCWLPVTPTLPSTLESRGLDSSSWAVHLQKLDHFEFDMDFPRLHAMLRWLHEELWDCTINFVLEHKLIEMADPLRYVAGSKEAYAAVYEVRQNRRARVDRLDFSHRPHSGSRQRFPGWLYNKMGICRLYHGTPQLCRRSPTCCCASSIHQRGRSLSGHAPSTRS